jgi:hypothetical protein
MSIQFRVSRTAAACLLALLVLLGAVVGCGPDPGETSTTTVGGSTTVTGDGSTSTTAPVQLTEWDKEIKKTAAAQHELTKVLLDENAPNDDPRMGIIYGLSARTQAIACRQAIDKNDLELADTAMLEVYHTLNLGRGVATGTTAQTLADARAIIDALGKPSSAPEEAATLLDEFIAALTPLVDEAVAALPSTTTT